MPPNRIVALFTPVIGLAAGAAAAWLSETIPGLDVSPAQMEAAFIAGLAAVLAPAAQWLYGSHRTRRAVRDRRPSLPRCLRVAICATRRSQRYGPGRRWSTAPVSRCF